MKNGFLLFLVAGLAATAAAADEWTLPNYDLANSRHPRGETAISVENVARLAPVETITTSGSNWATPTVQNGEVFVTDSGGALTRIDAKSGDVLWSHQLSDYNGVEKSSARTSVIVADDLVLVGDRSGAHMIAVEIETGKLRWITQLDDNPRAIITGSPIRLGDRLYVGVSSNEGSQFLKDRNHQTSFRGSLQAIDIPTGKIVWKTYTMPDNGGATDSWSGGAVISVPAIDEKRGVLYFTTDHHYRLSEEAAACLAAAPDDWDAACLPDDMRSSSVTALDLETGAVKWSFFGSGADVWEMACGELPRATYPFPMHEIGVADPVRICPPPGDFLNWSFAAGSPQLFTATIDGKARDLVGAAEKSGIYWAFDADSGEVVWHTLIGPWSEPGGLTWGAAYDGERLYLALTNLEGVPHRLKDGEIVTGGSWAALDPATGAILWQVGDPQNAPDYAAPVVANGVVYVGSMATTGDQMYALDASNGAILWRFAAGGSVASHPAISDGRVYWGSGFPLFGGVGNDKIYVFAVDGR